MTTRHLDRLIERDLEALRSYTPDYDVERGASRFALSGAALALGTLSAGVGSSGLSSFTKGLALKLLGLLVSTGGVAVVTLSPEFSTPADLAAAGAAPECVETGVSAPRDDGGPSPQPAPSNPRPAEDTPPPRSPTANVAETVGPSRTPPSKRASFQGELTALERAKARAQVDPSSVIDTPAPKGRFALEHEILAIRALVAMGRRDEARARIRRFLSEHPESAFSVTARELLGSPAATETDPSLPSAR